MEMTHPGDVILLMGARDPSLSDFAVEVLEKLPGSYAKHTPARH